MCVLIWQCPECPTIEQRWADEAEPGTETLCTKPLCNGLMKQTTLVPLSDLENLVEALKTIRGPSDSGPYITVYRQAGGGYEGLQAIARAALDGDQ